MAVRSLRSLYFIVPLVAAAGIAAACGPYVTPTCPADPPAPAQAPGAYGYAPVTNTQGQTYYVPQYTPTAPPTQLPGTSLSIVNGKLHLQGADGSKMTCEKFTVLVNGVEPAEVSVSGKEIRIASGKELTGDFLAATAQKVSRTGPEGATLVLEGNAKLLYVRKGKKIEVSTDLLSVNLSTGQVLSEMDAPKPAAPAAVPCVPCDRPPPATTPQVLKPYLPGATYPPIIAY